MPNWCTNTLEVKGNKKDVLAFKKLVKAKGTALSLAKICPEPDYTKVKVKPTYPKIREKYGKKQEFVEPSQAWWDWCIQNWGTKWDVEAQITEISESCLVYDFDSAWSPPTDWLKKAMEKFPELCFTLKYHEAGVGFQGIAEGYKGKFEDATIQYNEIYEEE